MNSCYCEVCRHCTCETTGTCLVCRIVEPDFHPSDPTPVSTLDDGLPPDRGFRLSSPTASSAAGAGAGRNTSRSLTRIAPRGLPGELTPAGGGGASSFGGAR